MSLNEGWSQGQVNEMSEDECLELLASKQVGRLAYVDPDGPLAVPVNYALDDGTVLFRTSAHASLGRYAPAGAALEVDDIDDSTHSGWSVLLRGPVEHVDADDLPTAPEGRPTPWPQGVRALHFRIRPRSITGRRLLPDDWR